MGGHRYNTEEARAAGRKGALAGAAKGKARQLARIAAWEKEVASRPKEPPPDPEAVEAEEVTDPVWEFARAMYRYQKETGKRYPTWGEVLSVLEGLGYRKAEPGR